MAYKGDLIVRLVGQQEEGFNQGLICVYFGVEHRAENDQELMLWEHEEEKTRGEGSRGEERK